MVSGFWGEHPAVFVLLVFFAIGCLGAGAWPPEHLRLLSNPHAWGMMRVFSSQHPEPTGRERLEPPQSKVSFWRPVVCLLLGLATIIVLLLGFADTP
jgi:hypothetical protein